MIAESRSSVVRLAIGGMHCTACSAFVREQLAKVSHVEQVHVDYASGVATLRLAQEAFGSSEQLAAVVTTLGQVITQSGYVANGQLTSERSAAMKLASLHEHDQSTKLWLLAMCSVFTVPLLVIAMSHGGIEFVSAWHTMLVQGMLATPVVLIGGWGFFASAIRGLRRRRAGMNLLVSLGTLTALTYSWLVTFAEPLGLSSVLVAGQMQVHSPLPHAHGAVYFEAAAAIITLVVLGKWLEARVISRTGSAVSSLLSLEPAQTTVISGNTERTIFTSDVLEDDVLALRPGQRVPTDGTVVYGQSSFDESLITGESAPRLRTVGSAVIAGSLNLTGIVHVRASRRAEDSTISQLITLVGEAATHRMALERTVDRVSGVFAWVVIAIALITATLWLVFAHSDTRVFMAVTTAMSVLVISCPCALGLATPMAIMVGTARAAQAGIVLRRVDALETAAQITDLVFDKTGTITMGSASVVACDMPANSSNADRSRALVCARLAAASSNHPTSLAIARWIEQQSLEVTSHDFSLLQAEEVAGAGVRASVADAGTGTAAEILLGKPAWVCSQLGLAVDAIATELTTQLPGSNHNTLLTASMTVLAIDRQIVACFWVKDVAKSDAIESLAILEKLDIRTHLLSGDAQHVVDQIAKHVGISNAVAGATPEQKLAFIRALQAKGSRVAMAGDGINDAAAIAAADLGIAMGSGTDAAVRSSAMTILRSDLLSVPRAIVLSRRTLSIIHQNLWWAFAYNVLAIPIAAGVLYPATGWLLSPMIASVAMTFSSISVVMNSLRLQRA